MKTRNNSLASQFFLNNKQSPWFSCKIFGVYDEKRFFN